MSSYYESLQHELPGREPGPDGTSIPEWDTPPQAPPQPAPPPEPPPSTPSNRA